MTKIYKIVFLLLTFFSSSIFSQAKVEDDSPKKKNETKVTDVVTLPDSVAASELVLRAVNWVKMESARYGKTSGVTTSNKAECIATFTVKPKELNPECDFTGKITMKVTVECKDSRYKYTVSQIKHTSKNGNTTAGSIDNIVPECGSMAMGDLIWKKVKGEALKGAGIVVSDIKAAMQKSSADFGKDDW